MTATDGHAVSEQILSQPASGLIFLWQFYVLLSVHPGITLGK
jgi:hypothetical protein